MTRDWLATAIYKALKDNDEWALIQGTPESGRTVIDGDFNLQAVAEIILREADMMFPVVLDDVGRWRD